MIIKGLVIGIANIIPGVSGGTMAVSLAIYDDLIFAITHLKKAFKKSINILLPIGIGVGLGVIFFSYAIEILLSQYTFPTAMAFIGLILGGVPILYQEFKDVLRENNESVSGKHIAVFIVFFVLIIGMSFIQESSATFESLEPTFLNLLILFAVGIITAATMVIPGISGSLVLMILGYYYNIINTLTQFFDSVRILDWQGIANGLILLVPFGIGILLGAFLISKIIEYLFKNLPIMTYSAIFGLVLASPFAIFLNTDAIQSLTSQNTALFVIVGLILMVICFVGTYQLGKVDDNPNQT